MLKSKIHHARVTHADLQRVGSVTLDEDLLDAADLLPGEQVTIMDVTNGARLETYVVAGERGSGLVAINGAVARLVDRGDLVILTSYATMNDERARSYRPKVVYVDEANRPVEVGPDPATVPAGPGRSGVVDGSPPAPPNSETDDATRLDALIQAKA